MGFLLDAAKSVGEGVCVLTTELHLVRHNVSFIVTAFGIALIEAAAVVVGTFAVTVLAIQKRMLFRLQHLVET